VSGHQEACTILSLLFLSWTGLDSCTARLVRIGRACAARAVAARSFVAASMLASAAQTTFSPRPRVPCLPAYKANRNIFCFLFIRVLLRALQSAGASSLRSRAHIRQKSSPTTTPSATPPWSLVPFRLLSSSIEIALDFRAE
jgi:hypothetical protein